MVNLPNGEQAPVNHEFNFAISLHQIGKIGQAAELCRRIIKKQPSHSVALHLLVVTKRLQGRVKEAMS